jgi:hypothetical protein
LDSETGSDEGYFYAAGDQDEVAPAWYESLAAIRNTSDFGYDAWATPSMGVNGVGLLRNPVTGCHAALQFASFTRYEGPPEDHWREIAATVHWYFTGASDDFSVFFILD